MTSRRWEWRVTPCQAIAGTADGFGLSLRASTWFPLPHGDKAAEMHTSELDHLCKMCVCRSTSFLSCVIFFHYYPKIHFPGSFTAWLPHLSHVLLIKPEEVGISGIKGGVGWSREALSKWLTVHQVSQGQVSGMTMFSSYNVLINDLGIKISLMLMKCSGDSMLGSILNTEARNAIPEDLGDLDTSRREVIKSKSGSNARSHK